MKILISTGIYPPKTSGPAQYAKNMHDIWTSSGHDIKVKTYDIENKLPSGIRHLYYFFKILPSVIKSDFVFTLDTFSVGLPTAIACALFNKKFIIRTGGDFLWEGYVERTGDLVLLKDFYKTRIDNLNLKEKIIFNLTKWVLNKTDILIFSTEWQKNIFMEPYELQKKDSDGKIKIVENRYEVYHEDTSINNDIKKLNFIASTRKLKWKNIDLLKHVFDDKDLKEKGVNLITDEMPYADFMKLMRESYAVILVSLGDISPHMILDAIRWNKPFILTKENGLNNRIKDISLLVDPKDENDIKEKVVYLLDKNNYNKQVEKIKNFNFIHTWDQISKEIIEIVKNIK
jgi:hypothetical protein